jgi:hypothetical protein
MRSAVQCRGALLVDLSADTGAKDVGGTPISTPVGRGRSDLVVDAGATRTIGVPVPASAIAYLQSHGPINLQVILTACNHTRADMTTSSGPT